MVFLRSDLFFFQTPMVSFKRKRVNSSITPWNINMEPTNHPFNHLERKMIFQPSLIMFRVNLQGCSRFNKRFTIWNHLEFGSTEIPILYSIWFMTVILAIQGSITHRIHGTGICILYTCIWLISTIDVGKYIPYVDL